MNQKTTNLDTILEEIHRTRQQMAEKFGGDIAAIVEDARKRQQASGHPIWQGSPSSVAPKPPVALDEARVRALAEHYDNQTEDEQASEIEAALKAENQTSMMVPTELVPEIVKLINKKRPA